MVERLAVGHEATCGLVVAVLPDMYYEVKCSGCGKIRRVWHYNVLRGKGCRSCSQIKGVRRTKPGGGVTKEYAAYAAMLARCDQSTPSLKDKYEGTRYENMEVEPSWRGTGGFDNFLSDVGPAPEGYYLDREDNDEGYIKGNVRWVSVTDSNRNKSNTRLLTAFGQTKPLCDWARDLGLTDTAIRRRLNVLGWSVEDAVSKPGQGRV